MADIILDSFPFDSMEVLDEETEQMKPDREYEAEVFRKYFNMFLSNGVYYGDYNNYKENSMKVTADGGMNIRVAKGAGLIKGANFENTEERIITLERPASGSRIDRIVVQMNAGLDTRATKLIVKKGNSTTPAALQRDENIYEICIAQITVKSTTNITSADIVDKRANKDVCGIVNSLITVDGEELYQRFQDYIDSVTDNLVRKDQNNTIEGSLTVNGGIEANIKPKRLTYEDLNEIKNAEDAGFYYAVGGNQVTNRPSGVDGFSMIANRGGETPFVQMLISTSQNIGKYYYRIYQSTNASWGEWIEIHNSKFSNYVVLEGKVTLQAAEESGAYKQTIWDIPFPNGYNKDNCCCIAFGSKVNEQDGYSYELGIQGNTVSSMTGNIYRCVIVGARQDSSKISCQAYNCFQVAKTLYYKIVLMRIS